MNTQSNPLFGNRRVGDTAKSGGILGSLTASLMDPKRAILSMLKGKDLSVSVDDSEPRRIRLEDADTNESGTVSLLILNVDTGETSLWNVEVL